jgi:hypothetical protein
MADDDCNGLHVRAHAFRLLLSLERHAMAIEAVNADGKSVVVELSGHGPAILKHRIEELFEKHPEMRDWKPPPQI